MKQKSRYYHETIQHEKLVHEAKMQSHLTGRKTNADKFGFHYYGFIEPIKQRVPNPITPTMID